MIRSLKTFPHLISSSIYTTKRAHLEETGCSRNQFTPHFAFRYEMPMASTLCIATHLGALKKNLDEYLSHHSTLTPRQAHDTANSHYMFLPIFILVLFSSAITALIWVVSGCPVYQPMLGNLLAGVVESNWVCAERSVLEVLCRNVKQWSLIRCPKRMEKRVLPWGL